MMESAAALRSLHYPLGTVTPFRSAAERPCVVSMHNATWLTSNKPLSAISLELASSSMKRAGALVSCVKTSDVAVVDDSNGSLEKRSPLGSTFPEGFEELIVGICDDTQIAELKVKIGDFELNVKRDIKSPEVPVAVHTPPPPPPAPTHSDAVTESVSLALVPSSSSEKLSPFANTTADEKMEILEQLDACGADGYEIVSSPVVGSFSRCKKLRGKGIKRPIAREGQFVREKQVIGFVKQFNNKVAVRASVTGEIVKFLSSHGEAVGYGEPLVAILPHFRDIE